MGDQMTQASTPTASEETCCIDDLAAYPMRTRAKLSHLHIASRIINKYFMMARASVALRGPARLSSPIISPLSTFKSWCSAARSLSNQGWSNATMAEVFHRSTVVQPSEQVDSKERLGRSLDHLLERYLHLLDQYQTLQQELTQHLSQVRIHLSLFDCSLNFTGVFTTRPS